MIIDFHYYPLLCNSHVSYRSLSSISLGHMNVALEQTEEYMDGKLVGQYGDSFIRGNNIMYINLQRKRA